MTKCRHPLASRDERAVAADARAVAPSLVLDIVRGTFFVALVAVLSLPQARATGADLGWVPFWLLALPASAWVAIVAARWQGARAPRMRDAPPALRRTWLPARRRAPAARRLPRHARAA